MGILKSLGKIGIAALNPIGTAGYVAYKSLTQEGRKDLEESVDEFIDDAFDTGEKIYDTVSDGYNTVTGRKLVDEAIERGERLKSLAEEIKYNYQYDSSVINENINNAIDSINQSKRRIKEDLFRNLAEKLNALKSYKIEDYPFERHFYSVRNITLNSNFTTIAPFSIAGINVITPALGLMAGLIGNILINWHTANKINEELDKEEWKIREAIEKCDAELRRLYLIETSVCNISTEFTNLEDIFKRVVVLIDEPIRYMKSHEIHKFSLLPDDLKKKFQAVMQIKDILKGVVERQIFKFDNQHEVQQYEQEIKQISSSAYLELEQASGKTQGDKSTTNIGKGTFIVQNVYRRTATSARVIASITSGSLKVGDKIHFTANSNRIYGPYTITSITPNGQNCVVIELQDKNRSSLTNTVYPDWKGFN